MVQAKQCGALYDTPSAEKGIPGELELTQTRASVGLYLEITKSMKMGMFLTQVTPMGSIRRCRKSATLMI